MIYLCISPPKINPRFISVYGNEIVHNGSAQLGSRRGQRKSVWTVKSIQIMISQWEDSFFVWYIWCYLWCVWVFVIHFMMWFVILFVFCDPFYDLWCLCFSGRSNGQEKRSSWHVGFFWWWYGVDWFYRCF